MGVLVVRGSGRWATRLLRALVLALALPLVTSGGLPVWALLAGIDAPHVCHCGIQKHDCVCAKCDPEKEELLLTTESLTGRCGDDEIAFGGKAICALLIAPVAIAPLAERVLCSDPPSEPLPILVAPPPTPPPRTSSSRTA